MRIIDERTEKVGAYLHRVGPWWSKTWWGRRHDAINVSLLIALLLFLLWKSF